MFVNRLTFKEIDNVLEKIFPIVFIDKAVIGKIMNTKTVAILSDKVEITFKIHEEPYSCELTDFDINFSFNVPRHKEANFEYRVIMSRRFVGKDKKGNKTNIYLSKLDEHAKAKWEQEFKTLVEKVDVDLTQNQINQI
ncbi:MAG: hypothetical protein J6Q13_03770 [Clostridia bacterium]|nr:hypothetical protein [Clostridia bacterium]